MRDSNEGVPPVNTGGEFLMDGSDLKSLRLPMTCRVSPWKSGAIYPGHPSAKVRPRVLQVLRRNGPLWSAAVFRRFGGKREFPSALSYDADLRAAEHRRTPQRKRNYSLQ